MNLIQQHQSLKQYNSWWVGGEAQYFCLPQNLDELLQCLRWAQTEKHEVTVLGGGSNVLISDQGIPGLTVCLKSFSGLETDASGNLVALAGTSKYELLKYFLKHKSESALFLSGIPGEVGGGVVMNAGVGEQITPREFCEIVRWIEVLKPDLSLRRYEHSEIEWSYRHSRGWQPGIITRVGLRADGGHDPTVLDKVKQANSLRSKKQPLDLPSCGSVFKNPAGHKAAQLIESCGLKGFAIGGAQVSPKHANFIVNTGAATASELWQVITHVEQTVKAQTQVELQTEVIRLGSWPVSL